MFDPVKLIRHYETGALTWHELVGRLCQAAAESEPAEIAAELPADVLAEIRVSSASPPDSPDRCRVFGSVCAGPDFDAEAYFRQISKRLYDGLWRWHRYFVETEPHRLPLGDKA